MTAAVRPLWRGRVVVLLGIVLVSMSLRTVLAATSPIVDVIQRDVPLSTTAIAIIGTLPPLCFAIIGLLTPRLTRRVGLVVATLIALGVILVGHAIRATAPNAVILIIGTAVALAGMGAGNVTLAPLVKRYFPDRIPLMTALYTSGYCISTLAPALVVGPMAEQASWRWSFGIWVSVTVLAAIPWIIQLRKDPARDVQLAGGAATSSKPFTVMSLWRSPVAVALAVAGGINSFQSFTIMAWYPQMLLDSNALTNAEVGPALAIHAGVGISVALLLPIVARHLKSLSSLFWLGGSLMVISHLVVLLAPGFAPMAIMVSTGIGLLNLPVVFVLMPQRTRTEQGTVVLSGFVNAVNCGIAATGPLLTGLIHEATGSWTVPLIVLAASSLLIMAAAVVLRSGHYVEDAFPEREPATD